MPEVSCPATVQAALQAVSLSIGEHREAYTAFLAAAQRHEWEAAEQHRVVSLAWVEAAHDAFLRACRVQEEMEREAQKRRRPDA